MCRHVPEGPVTVVVLPGEIDVSNARQVCDLLDAAAGPGTRVVVADCSATAFCDAAGARRLVTVRARAAVRGVQVRLVIPPGGLLRRVLELLAVDNLLPVYASVGQASMMLVASAQDPLSCPVPEQAEGTA